MLRRAVLSRRRACRLLAVLPAAVAVAATPGLPAAERKPAVGLRYVLASSLYGRMRLEDVLPEVRKTGATAIDLWPEGHANQREQMDALGHDRFAGLLRRHGIGLAMTTRFDLGPFGLREEMRVVRRLGGSLVVTGSGGAGKTAQAKVKDAVRQFVARMQPHVAAAEELEVTIAIENHAKSLIDSPDSIRWLAELARSPRLGIALAPYHLPQDPAHLARLIDDLGPKLAHFYAWQYGRGCFEKLPKAQELEQMPGRGTLDFRPLVAALKRIDYRGLTEIFMHPVPRGIPILDTAAAVTGEVNRARRHLEEIVEGLLRGTSLPSR